jgi:NADH:ubiquinone oxidoreductase subunit 3 (subunit A)
MTILAGAWSEVLALALLTVAVLGVMAMFVLVIAHVISDEYYERGRRDAYDAAHDPRRLEVRRRNDAEWEALQAEGRRRARMEEAP